MRIEKTQVEYEGRVEEREVIVEEQRAEPWGQDAELEVVGKRARRVDGVARVTGQAVYTQDVYLPGMLTGRFLRSPHPHARLKRIDTSRAEALPGVWLVWHCRKAPRVNSFFDVPIFAEEMPYQGFEVAFVAAADEETAEEALDLIEVEYEPLPFVHDLASALADEAPRALSSLPDNLVRPHRQTYTRGDLEAGEKEAEVSVDLTFTTPVAAHCSLETHSTVANWEGNQLTLWHSTQSVFDVREEVAEALGLPQDDVRLICNFMGGGFGSKLGPERDIIVAAQAARETGRPVRLVLDRAEEFLTAGYRPSSRQHVRIGARRDGQMTFIDQEAWSLTGAYGGESPMVTGPARSYYSCPNVRAVLWGVRANVDKARPFRAPGYVEGTAALEQAVDALAEKLGLDPLELRLKNIPEQDQARQLPYTDAALRDAYRLGAEAFGWQKRGELPRQAGPFRRGFGMATQVWGGGGSPPANALVKLLPDGTAEVIAGSQDIGTGTRTVIAQVAAEELGLPLEQVRVVLGDTGPAPYGPGSGGSTTTASITPAVREAAYAARQQLFGLAVAMLGLPDEAVGELEARQGEIRDRRDPSKKTTWNDVAAKMGDYTIVGRGARGPNPEKKAINTFGAHFVEVEVNVETGAVRVARVVAAHAIGRVLNPMTADSQVYGGVTQGLGFALMEQRVIDRQTGVQLTASLADYRVPTIRDVPKIAPCWVERADPAANSVGGKGLGEPPIIPAPAAIANAVADAIGVRVVDLPITPGRVLEALHIRKEEGKPS